MPWLRQSGRRSLRTSLSKCSRRDQRHRPLIRPARRLRPPRPGQCNQQPRCHLQNLRRPSSRPSRWPSRERGERPRRRRQPQSPALRRQSQREAWRRQRRHPQHSNSRAWMRRPREHHQLRSRHHRRHPHLNSLSSAAPLGMTRNKGRRSCSVLQQRHCQFRFVRIPGGFGFAGSAVVPVVPISSAFGAFLRG